VEQSPDIRQQVRVLLVDHSDLILQGLKTTLSQIRHIVVVGTANTQGEAVALLRTCRPDVVVLDIQVGHSSGIELCRTIRKSYPQIAVLFFTANDEKLLLRAAILAGAQGYLLKRASSQAVAKAIEIVSAGRAVVDQQLTQELLAWVRDGKRTALRERVEDCSSADRRILSLIAAGQSTKEIARELKVTPSVLAARLRRLYKRLNISNRSQAARHFVQWEKGPSGRTNHSHSTAISAPSV